MAVKIRKGDAFSTMNMTPMIDVVFQLLIFFLIATEFAHEDRALQVQLPSASEAAPITAQPQQMFVNIDHEGRIFIDARQVDLGELENLLERAVVNNPVNQAVVIRADKRVPFDYPVQVVNLCIRLGVRNYSINTEDPQGVPVTN